MAVLLKQLFPLTPDYNVAGYVLVVLLFVFDLLVFVLVPSGGPADAVSQFQSEIAKHAPGRI